MKTKALVVSAVAISLLAVGAAAAGFGGIFSSNFGFNPQNSVQYNWSSQHNSTSDWNSTYAYNGIGRGRPPYNGTFYNRSSYNASSQIKQQASVAQCETTYADSEASAVSSDFGIGLGTSEIDQANANVQANVTSNATSWYARMSLQIFENAYQGFNLAYAAATHRLNATQQDSLKTSLSTSITQLGSCISSNSVSSGHGQIGIGAGFGSGVQSGFGQQGGIQKKQR